MKRGAFWREAGAYHTERHVSVGDDADPLSAVMHNHCADRGFARFRKYVIELDRK